jgi:anti-repressor protein
MMTNEIVAFQFETRQIRTALDDAGDPWFVAKDVSDCLGYSRTSDALEHANRSGVLPQLNKINGLSPATKWVPEADVYRMVMRSNLPDAVRFQDWVVERGTKIGKVADEMWGEVNSYPRPVLAAAFDVVM